MYAPAEYISSLFANNSIQTVTWNFQMVNSSQKAFSVHILILFRQPPKLQR